MLTCSHTVSRAVLASLCSSTHAPDTGLETAATAPVVPCTREPLSLPVSFSASLLPNFSDSKDKRQVCFAPLTSLGSSTVPVTTQSWSECQHADEKISCKRSRS